MRFILDRLKGGGWAYFAEVCVQLKMPGNPNQLTF